MNTKVYKGTLLKYEYMKKGFRLYFEEEDYERWQKFCEFNFKSKKVLSKIVTEAMEEYIENFEQVKK